ncbi:2-hydroxyacid dehydrogenase [Pigmentiphaga soli]|uniref:2-hydroxyacid dehydrogenase n=1 Tax=Pigmentiphaga soli TaxID=1007095 RepID=A0ABP8H6P7_9BURK
MTPILVITHLPDRHLAQARERYEIIYAPDRESRAKAVAEHGHRIRAALTIGSIGLTGEEIAAMPKLELISALGVGYELIDLDAARARGIALSNGAFTNDRTVADHAFALLLAIVRQIPLRDRTTRQGAWRTGVRPPPQVSGKRLGILGMGAIGGQIARRAAGFDLEVGYHNRRPRADSPHAYFDSPAALAAWCDYLIVATPGGAGTRHLVDAEVLRALGPKGYLVNISRGSVVDGEALAAALRDDAIAGAGIDVFDVEPPTPAILASLDKAVLSPHLAGSSPESQDAMVDRWLDNVARHFSGQPLTTPI